MPVKARWATDLLLAGALILLGQMAACAGESRQIVVGEEPEIPVEIVGDSERLLIWLPNESGPKPGLREVRQALAKRGLEVWNADLHAAWFAPPGRTGLRLFEPRHVSRLIDAAVRRGKRHIVLIGSDRGALLALRVARAWQVAHPGRHALDGVILLDPIPHAGTPVPGEKAKLAAILRATNLPVFLIQPEHSTRFPRRRQTAETLLSGGAPLFARLLEKIHSGFESEPDEDLGPIDLAGKRALPALLDDAMRKLARAPHPSGALPLREPAENAHATPPQPTLLAWHGKTRRIALRFPDLNGVPRDLSDYRGKVVLINFWASWCPPCVEELPSLIRLKQRLRGQPFEILGVDIGEEAGAVREFLKRFEINYPILLDRDAVSTKRWLIHAYPSSFLIDKTGRITHAYQGGLAWDSDAIVAIIREQLERIDPASR